MESDNKYLDVEYVSTNIFGLTHIEQFEDATYNDLDMIPEWKSPDILPQHFSKYDDWLLRRAFRVVKDDVSVILEIGVHRPNLGDTRSSTKVFLEEKNPETIYLGVDLEDKREVSRLAPNTHVMKRSSSDHLEILHYIKNLGHSKIDFLFIDGFHSVNQVYSDWEYVEWLSDTGVVCFHDTNFHPGPIMCFNSIDETLFDKRSLLKGKNDWGLSFAWRK